jgi:heme exporter protein C
VYAIVAGLTVPFFIFVMPRMMVGLHPGARDDPGGTGPVFESGMMAPNMRVLFYISLLGFTLLFLWLLNLRIRAARLERQSTIVP